MEGFVTKAVFKLGRNIFSLIANETYFVMESVHIRQGIARIMLKHDCSELEGNNLGC